MAGMPAEQKGLETPEQRAIRKNFTCLLDCDASRMLPHLFEKCVIDMTNKEDIQAITTSAGRMDRLLCILLKKRTERKRMYSVFLETLGYVKRPDLTEKLNISLHCIKTERDGEALPSHADSGTQTESRSSTCVDIETQTDDCEDYDDGFSELPKEDEQDRLYDESAPKTEEGNDGDYQRLIFKNRFSRNLDYENQLGNQDGANNLAVPSDTPDGLTRSPSKSVYDNAKQELNKDKNTGWFGESTEEKVQSYLNDNWRLNGNFVVWLHRDVKTRKKSLALSVINERKINHFQIRGVSAGMTYKFYIVKQHYQAGYVRELLDYYHRNSLPLMDSEVKLTNPLGK